MIVEAWEVVRYESHRRDMVVTDIIEKLSMGAVGKPKIMPHLSPYLSTSAVSAVYSLVVGGRSIDFCQCKYVCLYMHSRKQTSSLYKYN